MTKRELQNKSETEILVTLQKASLEQLLRLLEDINKDNRA